MPENKKATENEKLAELRRAALEYHEFPIPGKIAIAATKQLINQHDLSLFKKFKLFSEKRTLEFRFETFNTFNHTQFSAVNTAANFAVDGTQTSTAFGTVTAARDWGDPALSVPSEIASRRCS